MILASRIALVLLTILGFHYLMMIPAAVIPWLAGVFEALDYGSSLLLSVCVWAICGIGILRYREVIWNRRLPVPQVTGEAAAILAAVLLALGTWGLSRELFSLSQVVLMNSELPSPWVWISTTEHGLGLLAGGLLFFGAWPIAAWWDKQPEPPQGDAAESPVIVEP